MKVAVLGYGLIGRERVAALKALQREGVPIEAIALHDPALREAPEAGLTWCADLDAVRRFTPAWLVVATPHDVSPTIALQVASWGCQVLIEKPMGRSLDESRMIAAAFAGPNRLWLGFNYPFFPGVAALLKDVAAGTFGQLVSVDMTLGHGGSPELEHSWKMDPLRVGGGCLLDPGTHLLDLCRRLAPGGLDLRGATGWDGFWKRGFEEAAHLLFAANGFSIHVDVSIVRWRSTFVLEVHGADGYGVVEGRGRSYGVQTYRRGKRWGWRDGTDQKSSETTVLTSDCSASFTDELRALLVGPQAEGPTPCSMGAALQVMELHSRAVAALSPRRMV